MGPTWTRLLGAKRIAAGLRVSSAIKEAGFVWFIPGLPPYRLDSLDYRGDIARSLGHEQFVMVG